MAIDKGFAKRLNEACDGHPHIPEYGHGRQTWVKEKMDVSHEAVRKWFMGQARPRPDKMAQLAALLEVDQAWLALGMQPDQSPREKRTRDATVDGAVNALMGIMQMNGGHVAFPDEKDPRSEYVDFYCILRGIQSQIHVALADEKAPGQYLFTVPKQFDQVWVIGIIRTGPLKMVFLNMTPALIDKYKVRKGGYYTVAVSKSQLGFISAQDTWPKITSFHSL